MGCVAHDAKVGELLARTVHERSTGALGSESNFSSKGAPGYSESILGDVILKLSVTLTEVCELLGGKSINVSVFPIENSGNVETRFWR